VAAGALVGALGLLLAAPSWHARTMAATVTPPPQCVSGTVYTECVAHFGAHPAPTAKLTLRRRRRPAATRPQNIDHPHQLEEPEPLEVEWAGPVEYHWPLHRMPCNSRNNG
jgi:hypothetical protein